MPPLNSKRFKFFGVLIERLGFMGVKFRGERG